MAGGAVRVGGLDPWGPQGEVLRLRRTCGVVRQGSTLIPFDLGGDRSSGGDPHVTEGETDPSPARSTGSVDPAAGDLTDRCSNVLG